MIFAVCYVESKFDRYAGRGALGLMQILYKYAAKSGITKTMLYDPHTNMELGVSQLHHLILSFNGDTTAALAAYNMGAGKVRNNPDYNRGYANTIFKWMDNQDKWLKANGFATEFKEQLTLKK